MRAKLTPALVKTPLAASAVKSEMDSARENGRDRIFVWDEALEGFGLMLMASGSQSYVVQYRHNGKSPRMSLSNVLDLTIARKRAKAILGEAAQGRDPIGDERRAREAAKNTLRFVYEGYFARDGGKLKSSARQKQDWERLILPKLGSRPIAEIKRSDIVKLMDEIEDERGALMAHNTLAYLSKLFVWHAARDDDFRSPVVRGMGRRKVSETARDRTLSDDELRALWRAAEADTGPYGAFVRLLLLTASRRTEVARMTWDELAGDDWIIPATRMKGKHEHVVPLSPTARDLLARIPRIGPYVFTGDGKTPIGFSWRKAGLDKVSGVTNWRLHDLRRTARSLMSRAGVDADTAERCLAHKIGGVRGVYDRYAYHTEKKRALEALAQQIDRILNPPANNVRSLDERRATA